MCRCLLTLLNKGKNLLLYFRRSHPLYWTGSGPSAIDRPSLIRTRSRVRGGESKKGTESGVDSRPLTFWTLTHPETFISRDESWEFESRCVLVLLWFLEGDGVWWDDEVLECPGQQILRVTYTVVGRPYCQGLLEDLREFSGKCHWTAGSVPTLLIGYHTRNQNKKIEINIFVLPFRTSLCRPCM